MKAVMKQTQLFLTRADEAHFWKLVTDQFDDCVVIDGQIWKSPDPPERPDIVQCTSSIAYLWNKRIVADLSCHRQRDGSYRGHTGALIQFCRSIWQTDLRAKSGWNGPQPKDEALLSGSMSVSYDAEAATGEQMAHFVKTVWQIVNKMCTSALVCVDRKSGAILNPKVPMYRVGPDARQWCLAGKDRFLGDRATENYYRPPEDVG